MNLGINVAEIDISMQLSRGVVLVVLPDAERADWYMENCYEYYTRVIVVSADGVYPYHHKLKELVKDLWEDPTTNIFVFGNWCIQDNPPAGNVFSLDRWAVELSRKRSSRIHKSVASLDWTEDPIVLARMIRIFASGKNYRNSSDINMYNVKQQNHNFEKIPEKLHFLIKKG